MGFALVASVFLWLYETWIHQLVTGPVAPGAGDASLADQRRRGSIRTVFVMELALVSGFVALAHALLDLDWTANGGWGASPVSWADCWASSAARSLCRPTWPCAAIARSGSSQPAGTA